MIPDDLPANAIACASSPCKMKSRKRRAHFPDFGYGNNDRHPSFSATPSAARSPAQARRRLQYCPASMHDRSLHGLMKGCISLDCITRPVDEMTV
jgi:hypothetical protein